MRNAMGWGGVFLAVWLAGGVAGMAEEGMDEIYAHLQADRFVEAHGRLIPLHEAGHADASRLLGCLYLNGDGVAKDLAKGLEYLRSAVAKGDAEAAFQLGVYYRHRDGAEYARLQKLAAQRGHLIAAQQIGLAST